MSLTKYGSPQKIEETASTQLEFEQMKDKIAKENNLIRCHKCGKLVAKTSGDHINVKKGKVDVVAQIQKAEIKCPQCGDINIVEPSK